MSMLRRRQMMAYYSNFIYFENKEVERICLANFDEDGDGRISKEDAEKVTSFGSLFNNIGTLENLNDFRFFYNVKNVSNAFIGCSNIKIANIWEGVTAFGDNLFMGASKIEKAVIPTTVQNMGQMWVRSRLIASAIIIMLPKIPPKIPDYNISSVANVVYVPDESLDLYKSNEYVKKYLSTNILPISQYNK